MVKKDENGIPLILSKGFFGKESEGLMKKMDEKELTSLEEQLNDVIELGVKFIACDMSMDMMDITKDELIDGVEVGGIRTYVEEAKDSAIDLFI